MEMSNAMRRRLRSRKSAQWHDTMKENGYYSLYVTFDIPATPLMDVLLTTMVDASKPLCTMIYVYTPLLLKQMMKRTPEMIHPLRLLCQSITYAYINGPQNPMPLDHSVFTTLPVLFR